jgi:O-antigen ligase
VPTRTWLEWGVNLYTQILGFRYDGPGGLPANFFVTLPDGTLLRRMVSTYISPLGIAYTGLLLFPLGVVFIDRQRAWTKAKWFAIALLTLVVIGVLFTVTRLAMLALVGEAVLLILVMRRIWVASLVPVLALAVVLMLYPYASLGPAIDRNLVEVKRTQWQWAISGNDSSAQEHYSFLIADLEFDLQHPLGLGTGASVARYGQLVGTGESAILGMFGDLGIVGGAMYVALYLLALWNGYRAYRAASDTLAAALPIAALVGGLALLPITLTSDIWGDLSVTFLFWWAAGASATMAKRRAAAAVDVSLPAGPLRPVA